MEDICSFLDKEIWFFNDSIIILSPFIVYPFAIKIAIFKSLNIDVLIVWLELYESITDEENREDLFFN